MESKIYLLKKPAAGAARIGILYRSPPLVNVQNFRKGGGSVEISPDVSKFEHGPQKVFPATIRIILYRSPPLPKILVIFKGGGSVQNPEPSGACGGLLFGKVNLSNLYRICINIQFIVNNFFLKRIPYLSFLKFRMENMKIKLSSEYLCIDSFLKSFLALCAINIWHPLWNINHKKLRFTRYILLNKIMCISFHWNFTVLTLIE